MNNNIFLIGFMGSGKSTVGNILSKRLGYSFVDTDELVEEDCEISICTMFDKFGEKYFREKEYVALKKVLENKNQVVSTGGGIVTYDKSRELLEGQEVYYIDVDSETVYQRLKSDSTRPLLKNSSFEKMSDLLSIRKKIYENTCTRKIDGKKEPEKVAEDIIFNMTVIHDKP
ncbi:shikimate kinase [uncultured Ilyobacter sp.]|uniref:shikimate kinase n=1 Tax=uncultured Ilyobacter sp. TaxID=544433 RepID=UPI0029C89FE8|nr:shikimate kinase [uncultured Ilyobacter sp.]